MPRKGGRNRGPNDRKGRKGPSDDGPRTPKDRPQNRKANRAKASPKASPTRASRAESKRPEPERAKSNRPEPKRRRRKPELVLRRMRPIAHRGGRRERANRRMIVIER